MPAKKQVTKDMILSAAMELLRAGGIEAVSIKALAGKLGCSTQPVYLSFESMDALRAELGPMAVNFSLQIMNANGSAEAKLYGMGYILFAQHEPALFRFLFMRPNAFTELKAALTPVTERAIARMMEKYQLDHETAHFFHDQLWMHSHGIASMIATGFCTWDMDKVARMLQECEDTFQQEYGDGR